MFHASATVVTQGGVIRGVMQIPGDPVGLPVSATVDGTSSVGIPTGAAYFGIANEGVANAIRFHTGSGSLVLSAGQGAPIFPHQYLFRKVPSGHTHIALREG